jgi:hypothetical protein
MCTKRNPNYTISEDVNNCHCNGNQYEGSLKKTATTERLKISLQNYPAIPLLGIDSKGYISAYKNSTCMPTLIAALLQIASYRISLVSLEPMSG